MTAHTNHERPQRNGAKKSASKPEKKTKRGNVFLSGLKNFGIVFILCLVVFGLIASLAVSFVTSAVDDIFEEKNQLEEILKNDPEVIAASEDDVPLPDGESFTVFIAVTDFDPVHYNYYPYGSDLDELRLKASDRSMGILSAGYKSVSTKLNVVVRFDKERREYTVTPVSSHTRIFTPAGYLQLCDLYQAFGPQFLVDKVEALTGFGIDYYMFFDAREAPAIASALGTFNVELSKDIYSDGAAFGTADRSYDDVKGVIVPETIPVETKKSEKDKKKKDDGTDETETEEETTVETEETTSESKDDKREKWIREARETYHCVVSAGTVTVSAYNIRALLMFDDYRASSADERAELEYQLVRGALLNLASMSDEGRLAFYDSLMLETVIENCSVTYGHSKLDDEEDANDEGEDEDEDEKESYVPAGYGTLTDGKINTDISRKVVQLKSELVAAAMRFPVKHLEFEGRNVNGFFAADLTGNSSRFMQYKLPAHPEKNVALTN